jgi:hypothetical protein
MTEPVRSAAARPIRVAARSASVALVMAVLTACVAQPSTPPTLSPPPTTPPTQSPTQMPSLGGSTPPAVSPSATPEPPLSLDLPSDQDRHRVSVEVAPEVPAGGDGRIMVTVTNQSGSRVDELVLRWPSQLDEALYLAPFAPSEQRIANGGPPLWQEWTKWVLGPGERGEPAGTISLGWGPLLAGGTLTIPILVTRRAPGPVAFDLQLLAEEAILTLDDGGPAELRVSVP